MITNWKTILLISLILMVELVSYQPAQADEDEEGNTETTEDVSSEATRKRIDPVCLPARGHDRLPV